MGRTAGAGQAAHQPAVALLGERLAAEAGPAAQVQQQPRAPVVRQRQQLQRALRQLRLRTRQPCTGGQMRDTLTRLLSGNI